MNAWERQSKLNDIEDNGVPVVVKEHPGWRFFVRPASKYSTWWRLALLKYSATPQAKKLAKRRAQSGHVDTPEDERLDADLMRKTFVDGCLASWEGVTGPDGAPLEFNTENARKFLAHFRGIASELMRVAHDPKNFEVLDDGEKAKAIAGN